MVLLNRISDKIQSLLAQTNDFRTNRKIIVFESDDWGSIRMSSRKDWNELLKLGYSVDKRPYERFDTLESAEDIDSLFSVLRRHKDSKGSYPVITMNMLMANPDFEKMERNSYKYSYEPIRETYFRYWNNTKAIELLKEGLAEGLIMPQSHGREHFNVHEWEEALRMGNSDVLTAFNHKMCGIAPKDNPNKGNKMMVALSAVDDASQSTINHIVEEGLHMFEKFWGFKSKTFVAPCYAWNEEIEKILFENGVELIQASRVRKTAYQSPKSFLYSGQRNSCSQIYSIRNCEFEPATSKGNALNICLSQIENAFLNRKLAVVSTHRINYVGGISENNRQSSLKQLERLLSEIENRFTNVEYLSSDKLIDVFNKDKN